MANMIMGRVLKVGEIKSITTKLGKPFCSCELILDATRYDSMTGEKLMDNFPTFEFIQDKVDALEGLVPGDVVTVYFDLRGTRYTGKEGTERYFTHVQGYKVERKATTQQAAAPAPQPQGNEDLPF